MLLPQLLSLASWACLLCSAAGLGVGSRPRELFRPYRERALQDIVTWDKHSIFVRGERIMVYSGEFHPFRLPVPTLWLDIFQKLRAAGFSAVSFYADWALLEGKPGSFSAEGIFAFEPFFEAASRAGIYLIARPGPYINAEASGGGFPGWVQRSAAIDRTPDFLPLTENYVKNIGAIIAKAQITNGGPIIYVQPENEYTGALKNIPFPNRDYFAAVEKMLRDTGIVVPFVSNDALPFGLFAPGSGPAAVDIYGHDSYPLGFDCANPYTWPNGSLPTAFRSLHLQQSPSTPYTIAEFQGGSFDPWGGQGFDKCSTLLNQEFERVFFKNNYAADVTIFNIYMGYGGTNWGNLGHPGGYTSYDYGAMVAEDRTVTREKYSEAKLQANFFKVSPAYLVASAGNTTEGGYVNTNAITTTRLTTNTTNFYIVRHSLFNTVASTGYKLQVPTSAGIIDIPQLSSVLFLNGRDSKIHVVDYDVGGIHMLYSSAEIFTWKKYPTKTVLILYGGPNEVHEVAFTGQGVYSCAEGTDVRMVARNGSVIINWAVSPERRIIQVGKNLFVYLLDRNSAYNYWVLDLPGKAPENNFTVPAAKSVIARAGYLLRTATTKGNTLSITGDINSTTTIEIIGGAPSHAALVFNGAPVNISRSDHGVITGTISPHPSNVTVPTLSTLTWHYVDSLPEIQSSYSDAAWPSADHKTSNNSVRNLTTPVSLYGSDYGFHAGNLLTRGHFTATGAERSLSLTTQGGTAFAAAVYLNSTLLSSWPGSSTASNYSQNISLPSLTPGAPYVLTILLDNMGLDEDFIVGTDSNKNPRGVLDYGLSSRDKSDISWKITGSLGGEDYRDRTRGPLNEGGLYAERMGYHLPTPPSQYWETRSPISDGIPAPGVGFFVTSFALDVPAGYDIPMAFRFANTSTSACASGNGAGSSGSSSGDTSQAAKFRAQLYVNGYQFGKFVNNVGPQTQFPVPEGILDYHGVNHVAVSLWGLDAGGNRLGALELVKTAEVSTGYGRVENAPMPGWRAREGAY